jgi:putative endonuclease
METRRRTGARGEDAAAAFLVRRGWTIIARNVRYREGELDVVCGKDGILAFVEVKTRRSTRAGTGAEAVTVAKQARIRRLAMRYLSEHHPRVDAVRFDVIELRTAGDRYQLRHLEGAF